MRRKHQAVRNLHVNSEVPRNRQNKISREEEREERGDDSLGFLAHSKEIDYRIFGYVLCSCGIPSTPWNLWTTKGKIIDYRHFASSLQRSANEAATTMHVVALFFTLVAASATSGTGSPIDRVVELINGFRAKIVADGAAEQKVYDKYACWCEKTTARKVSFPPKCETPSVCIHSPSTVIVSPPRLHAPNPWKPYVSSSSYALRWVQYKGN